MQRLRIGGKREYELTFALEQSKALSPSRRPQQGKMLHCDGGQKLCRKENRCRCWWDWVENFIFDEHGISGPFACCTQQENFPLYEEAYRTASLPVPVPVSVPFPGLYHTTWDEVKMEGWGRTNPFAFVTNPSFGGETVSTASGRYGTMGDAAGVYAPTGGFVIRCSNSGSMFCPCGCEKKDTTGGNSKALSGRFFVWNEMRCLQLTEWLEQFYWTCEDEIGGFFRTAVALYFPSTARSCPLLIGFGSVQVHGTIGLEKGWNEIWCWRLKTEGQQSWAKVPWMM